jgi:condensin complex subunit 3
VYRQLLLCLRYPSRRSSSVGASDICGFSANVCRSEVRRAILVSIARIPETLDTILARTRDTDATVRKMVYSAVLNPTLQQGDAVAVIQIAQREIIVRNGLGDREENPFAWRLKNSLELVRDQVIDQDKTEENGNRTGEANLVLFLKMFDLSECKVAEDALSSALTTQKNMFEELSFGGTQYRLFHAERAQWHHRYVLAIT